MFIRFVHATVKPEHHRDILNLYESMVMPALKNVGGCLFAGLIRNEHTQDEFISMTLWDTRASAETYELSPVYRELLETSIPFLAESSEWRLHLTKDLQLAYEAVPLSPVVRSHEVTAKKNSHAIPGSHFAAMYVRIVSLHVREGKMTEFNRLYEREILPVLQQVEGCRYAYLTINGADEQEAISVTIWESKRDADAYEQSGLFDDLKDRVKHTLSEIYQWKMNLQRESGAHVFSTGDVAVHGYSAITGKNFVV